MNTQKILVVEDDPALRRGIVDALAFSGFTTFEAADGPTGLESAVRSGCDLVLLDLVLPGMGGLEILSEVRRTRPTLPVIVLTALGAESDRVKGLNLGADDYVIKPFSVKELLARVRAVLRRSPSRPTDVAEVAVPGAVADLARREVRYDDGERCELTEREADMLRYFAQNAGRCVSRDELLAGVWRINPSGVQTRAVDMHIVHLREKLRDDKASSQIIRTVRGKGYVFEGTAHGQGS